MRKLPQQASLILFGGLGLVMGSMWVFLKLVSEIFEQEMNGVDQAVYGVIHGWASPLMDALMLGFTYIGSGVGVVILSIPLLLWLYIEKKSKLIFLFFFVANIGGASINLVLKHLYQRERPLLDAAIGATGYSLPSGHAMAATIFYGFLAYLFLRGKHTAAAKVVVCLFCIAIILLIGLSRIYLQAHYFTDVMAGYTAGLCWLVACIVALEVLPWSHRQKGI